MSTSRQAEARDVRLLQEPAADGLDSLEQAREYVRGHTCEDSASQPKATARAITMNFITGGLGSAIFSLPWSLAGTSIIPAIGITGVVLLINGWTISIVVRAAEKTQAFDLGAVISHLPGPLGQPLQILTNVFVWASMFLCLVSYIIVIHDSALHFVKGTFLETRIILVSLASLLVFPLCFLSQRVLEKTSSVAVAINIYLFTLVGVFYGQKAADDKLPEGCCILGSTVKGSFSMITVMFQAVIVQMCVLPMYEELENRSPQKFDKIIAVGFSVLFVIFCGFSTISYLLIGPSVSSNVLSDLPKNVGSDIAQLGVIFVVACVYPIMVYPMIAPLKSMEIFSGARQGPAVFAAKAGIVAAALLVSACVQSLGFVNVLNGAMSAGIFVALVPSVVGMVLLGASPCYKVALCILLICGLAVSASGFVFSDNYVGDLTCSIAV